MNLLGWLTLMFVLVSLPATACTPVPAVIILLGGTTFYGIVVGTGVGLVMAIVLKSVLYARFAGYGKFRGAFDMFMGNIGSTIPGLLIGSVVGSSALTLPGIVAAGLVLCVVASRVFSRESDIMSPGSLSGLTCGAMLFSYVLLMIAGEFDPYNLTHPGTYWALKIAGVFFGLVATLAISVVFEGAIIFNMHRKDESFQKPAALNAILKTNLWVFFLLSIGGALMSLPTRFSTPGFLHLMDM